jgi:hypothetical protein
MANDEARRKLMEGGLKDYYETMVVLRDFRRETLKECRRIVEKRLPELSRAIGGKLDQTKLADCIMPDSPYPEKKKWEEWWKGWAWIALELKTENINGLRQVLAGLCWTPKVAAVASFMVESRTLRDALLNRFKPREGFDLENWYSNAIVLSREVPPGELDTFPQSLDAVLGEWIRLWTEVGGMKSVLKER